MERLKGRKKERKRERKEERKKAKKRESGIIQTTNETNGVYKRTRC